MAYNIVLDENQNFSTPPSSDPLIQEWSFDPEPELNIVHIIGDPTPAPIDIATTIKNYLESLNTSTYSGIYIHVNLLVIHAIGEDPWVVLSGEMMDEMPTGYDIDGINPLNVTNTLTLQNLSLLNEQTYSGRIAFSVRAFSNVSLSDELIETVNYPFRLHVIDPNAILMNPEVLNYTHLLYQTLPAAQDLTITTQSTWTLRTDKRITVAGTGLTDQSTAEETVVTGTGTKILQIGLAAEINDIPESTFTADIRVDNDLGYFDSTLLSLTIFESVDFIFNPPSLDFFAIVSWQEADPLSFSVFGFGAFTLTAPYWLNLSANSGTNTGTFVATPLGTDTIEPGFYEGQIVLNAGGNDYFLPVSYLVAGTISTNLNDGNFNFTRELDYLEVYNINEGLEPEIYNIVKLILTVEIFNYVTFLSEEKVFAYASPFFNFKTKFHIGEIIERILKKGLSPTSFGYTGISSQESGVLPVYNPAIASANVVIINRDSEVEHFNETLSDMKFVAGSKPENFEGNSCILSNSFAPKRVTKNSKEILNFLINESYYKISIKRNDDAPVTQVVQSIGTNNIFRYAFGFSAYNPGDKITVSVANASNEFTKNYVLIPEGLRSTHIAYISQFKTLELFEFTGEWQLGSEIKRENNKLYRDLVEVFQTIRTSKDNSFVINTGFIFKEDEKIVDEILRSEKAWLMLEDNTHIELIPRAKKLIPKISNQELYSFTLEFEINRKKDAESYSF